MILITLTSRGIREILTSDDEDIYVVNERGSRSETYLASTVKVDPRRIEKLVCDFMDDTEEGEGG